MNAASIFRKVALERISSPEQLDQLLTVTTPRTWLALASMGLCLSAAVAWGFFGELPTKVSGRGALIRTGEALGVVPQAGGRVVDIPVRVGEHISAGQVVGLVAPPSTIDELARVRRRLAEAAGPDGVATPARSASDRVADLARDVALLEQRMQVESRVVSPYAGHVIDITATPGSDVPGGAPILRLRPDSDALVAVLYVPADKAATLRTGMEADVLPAGVRREEHGFLRGAVAYVSDRAVVRESGSDGPVAEVHVDIARDPTTPSGYRWSSTRGAPVPLRSGAPCDVEIVARRQSPISLVVPGIASAMGLR